MAHDNFDLASNEKNTTEDGSNLTSILEAEISTPEVEVPTPEVEVPAPEVENSKSEVENLDPEVEVSDPEVEVSDPEVEVPVPEVEVPEVEEIENSITQGFCSEIKAEQTHTSIPVSHKPERSKHNINLDKAIHDADISSSSLSRENTTETAELDSSMFDDNIKEISEPSTDIEPPLIIGDVFETEIQEYQKQKKDLSFKNSENTISPKAGHQLLKLYTKLTPNAKDLFRDMLKIALLSNGISIERADSSDKTPLKDLKLAFKDGDVLNLRVENLILVKPTPPVTREMILTAAEGANSVTQILQRIQKSPLNKNMRFKVENVLAAQRIILPP